MNLSKNYPKLLTSCNVPKTLNLSSILCWVQFLHKISQLKVTSPCGTHKKSTDKTQYNRYQSVALRFMSPNIALNLRLDVVWSVEGRRNSVSNPHQLFTLSWPTNTWGRRSGFILLLLTYIYSLSQSLVFIMKSLIVLVNSNYHLTIYKN